VFAAFLYNQEFECEREVNLKTGCTSNPFIDANLYFRGFKLIIVSNRTGVKSFQYLCLGERQPRP